MSVVWAIAKTTFHEALRRRVLNIVLLFAVVSILASRLFSWLSQGEEIKFILDMSSNSIRFFSMLIAVLLGASMIPAEVERRTIFTILAKPVGRTQFLLGKYLGGVLTLLTNIAIMGVIYLVVLVFKDRSYAFNATLWEGVLLMVMEVSLLLAIAVATSAVASTPFTMVFAFFIYFTGHMGEVFRQLSSPEHVSNVGVRMLMGFIYAILPHFPNFDLREPLLLGEAVPLFYVGKVIVSAVVYIGVVLAIGHLLFSQREF